MNDSETSTSQQQAEDDGCGCVIRDNLDNYNQYCDTRKVVYEQFKYVYDNIDKWLLTLSSGGLALSVALSTLTDIHALSMCTRLSVVAFLVSLLVAMIAKALCYKLLFDTALKIENLWKFDSESFAESSSAYIGKKFARSAKWGFWLNFVCFVIFCSGIVLLMAGSISSRSGPPQTASVGIVDVESER